VRCLRKRRDKGRPHRSARQPKRGRYRSTQGSERKRRRERGEWTAGEQRRNEQRGAEGEQRKGRAGRTSKSSRSCRRRSKTTTREQAHSPKHRYERGSSGSAREQRYCGCRTRPGTEVGEGGRGGGEVSCLCTCLCYIPSCSMRCHTESVRSECLDVSILLCVCRVFFITGICLSRLAFLYLLLPVASSCALVSRAFPAPAPLAAPLIYPLPYRSFSYTVAL
jgi:hypothetical protein